MRREGRSKGPCSPFLAPDAHTPPAWRVLCGLTPRGAHCSFATRDPGSHQVLGWELNLLLAEGGCWTPASRGPLPGAFSPVTRQIQGLPITNQGFGLNQMELGTTFKSTHFDGIMDLASSSVSALGLAGFFHRPAWLLEPDTRARGQFLSHHDRGPHTWELPLRCKWSTHD